MASFNKLDFDNQANLKENDSFMYSSYGLSLRNHILDNIN